MSKKSPFETDNVNEISHSKYQLDYDNPIRKQIDRDWRKVNRYLDKNFVKKFRSGFFSRLWEIEMATILLKNNFQVEPAEGSNFPDFIIKHENKNVYVEVYLPEIDSYKKRACERSSSGFIDWEEFITKLQKKVKSKKKTEEHIKESSYILALSMEQVLPYPKFEKVIEAITGLKHEHCVYLDPESDEFSEEQVLSFNQSKEILSFEKNSHIAAIYVKPKSKYSTSISNRKEQFSDGLLILNPSAKYPLNQNFYSKFDYMKYDNLGYKIVPQSMK